MIQSFNTRWGQEHGKPPHQIYHAGRATSLRGAFVAHSSTNSRRFVEQLTLGVSRIVGIELSTHARSLNDLV